MFGIKKVCFSLFGGEGQRKGGGGAALAEGAETDEADSVFLAAWTSARIPSASFSDGLRLGVQARVVAARVQVAVQETYHADKI